MKKLFLVLAVCALCFACKSPVEKAKEYSEEIAAAAAAGDLEKAEKIAAEAEEWMKGLSADEQAEVAKAMEEAGKAAMGAAMEQMGF